MEPELTLDVDDEEAIDLHAITSSIKSEFFWAYGRAVFTLQMALESFRGFCEACPCHAAVFRKMTSLQQQSLLRKERGVKESDPRFELGCPLGGRVAPDLALGAHKDLVKTLAESTFTQLLFERRCQLTNREIAQLRDDFTRGVERLQTYILVKTSAWDNLPLSLAGLAHKEVDRAKSHCRKLIATFDSIPLTEAKQTSHALTIRILSPDGEVRPLLDKWLGGEYDCDGSSAGPMGVKALLPDTLESTFAEMFLWPVVERWLESPHSVMKRVASYRNVGGAFCSLSVRYPQIAKWVATDPAELVSLTSMFNDCRSPLGIATALGISGEPAIADIVSGELSKCRRSALLRQAVGHAIYLTDAKSQWRSRKD